MHRVTASEFHRGFGSLSDRAIREPVAITKQGRDHLVLVSAEEYKRLKRRDRKVGLAEELPEDILAQIENSEVDPRHAQYDHELGDWQP